MIGLDQAYQKWLNDGGPHDWPADDPVSIRLKSEVFGQGPLEKVLTEPFNEIIINGHESIWVERQGNFQQLSDCFLNPTTLDNFVQRLCSESGLNLNWNVPVGDCEWRGFRVHIVRPPLAARIQLSIRAKPPRPWRLSQFVDHGWCSMAAATLLKSWLSERKNLMIVGPTGSGKTSVLNALLQEIPKHERVICLEDVSELTPLEGASCKLLTRFDINNQLREFNLSDLLRQALRMRPERLVLGEVRGPEAKDLLMALATGHRGSLGTLHAADARQALLRLEMLTQLGAPQWETQSVRQLIQLSIDGIVVLGFDGEKRVLEGLYRIASLETIGFLIEKIA